METYRLFLLVRKKTRLNRTRGSRVQGFKTGCVKALAARLHFLADRESKPLAGLKAVERLRFFAGLESESCYRAGPAFLAGRSPGSPYRWRGIVEEFRARFSRCTIDALLANDESTFPC
jgi:hypothetical protein